MVTCLMIIKSSYLHTMLPKSSSYVKHYNGKTKLMYFLIEDNDLLGKYNTIWHKVSADIKKEFDNEHACNRKILKIKIKIHVDEGTHFYGKKIPVVDSNHTFID